MKANKDPSETSHTLFQVEDLEKEDTTAQSRGSNSSLTLTQAVFKNVEKKIPKDKRNPFTLVTMSAGESMTDVFPEWIRCSFYGPPGEKRVYRPYDLNMPLIIPQRSRKEYSNDPPLTEHGKICASLVSGGLIRNKLRINIVYSAPEMICVMTAATAITAQLCKRKVRILLRIEPGLANYKGFRKPTEENAWALPSFYKSLGYPIDMNYEPQYSIEDLPSKETPEEYYQRICDCYAQLARDNEEECVLIVAHSSTVHIAKDGYFDSEIDLIKIRNTLEPCSVEASHFVIDGEHTRLSRPTLPLTRTLRDAREKKKSEKLEKKNEETSIAFEKGQDTDKS